MGTVLLSLCSYSQKLEENDNDEFTKQSVKTTSWESLCTDMDQEISYRIAKIDGSIALQAKIMISHKYFSISQGSSIMFKLSDDSVIDLKSLKPASSCLGCGATGFVGSKAPGVNVLYTVTDENLAKLKTLPVKKIRVYTDAGITEFEITDRKAQKFIKAVLLMD